ncbi:unnamed protein product [Linum tenue]|uniref:FAF domain-containing protein n=1 Tax=Linum tenue TaxID=586396 RepID=A0AAV0ISY6_9ROSI|nr:unnamed protein product [Linum tenue]
MSSISPSSYHQALQSCVESARLVEPRVLRLRLTQQTPNIASDPESNKNAGGFSFLQCIAAKETGSSNSNNSSIMKRSASSLSKQSLEMCTESLGSETGSDDRGSDDDELLLLPPLSASAVAADSVEQGDLGKTSVSISSSRAAARQRVRNVRRSRRGCVTLPPPLSSIGGSTGVRMRSLREDGRLVVTAVSVSPPRAQFHAERSNGRLRLHLTTEYPTQDEEAGDEKTEGAKTEEEISTRSGRCKEAGEGNRGLMNWEPFWVAT